MFKRAFNGREVGVLLVDGNKAAQEGIQTVCIVVDLKAGQCEVVVYDADGNEQDATATIEVLESFGESNTFLVSTPDAMGPAGAGPEVLV